MKPSLHVKVSEKNGWTSFSSGAYDASKMWRLTYYVNDKELAERCARTPVEWGYSPQGGCILADNGKFSVCVYIQDPTREGICRTARFMIDEKLIPATKSGKLMNAAFRLRGKDDMHLEDFADLESGHVRIRDDEGETLDLPDLDDDDPFAPTPDDSDPFHAQAASRSNRNRRH